MKIESSPNPVISKERNGEVENPEIRQVARQFESIFVNQMVGAMRKTIIKDGLIPESNAEKMYQSLLDAEYAQKISETDQMGLSNMVYDHLLRKAGAR